MARRGPRRKVMQALLKALWTDESGQDTTEYVLLVVLIALAVTLGMGVLATSVNNAFSNAGSVVDAGT
jgi:Flp pilus assembly pilin Flp